jgi:hypothetical protein
VSAPLIVLRLTKGRARRRNPSLHRSSSVYCRAFSPVSLGVARSMDAKDFRACGVSKLSNHLKER